MCLVIAGSLPTNVNHASHKCKQIKHLVFDVQKCVAQLGDEVTDILVQIFLPTDRN